MKTPILTLFAILLLCECTRSGNSDGLITVQITPGVVENHRPIKDFLTFSHYVILGNGSDALLGDIEKLQLLDGHIGIASSGRAFLFDSVGSLSKSWDRAGRASYEYIKMTDMELQHTDQWQCNVYDRTTGLLRTYDEANRMTGMRQLPAKAKAFKLLDGQKLALNMGNGASGFVKEDTFNYQYMDGETIVNKAIPIHEDMAGFSAMYSNGKSVFYVYGGKTYMGSQHNDTIYSVNSSTGKIKPAIAFDLGAKRPRHNDSKNKVSEYLHTIGKVEAEVPVAFHKFSNGFLAEYTYKNRPHLFICDEGGNVLYSDTSSRDEFGVLLRPVPHLNLDNSGYLISYYSPVNIERDLKRCQERGFDSSLLNELHHKLGDNVNPVLLFYKWTYQSI